MILKIPYLITLGLCAFSALYFRKSLLDKLPHLFCLTLLTFPIEVYADWHLRNYQNSPKELYWVFLLIEYTLQSLYFLTIIKIDKVRIFIRLSILVLFITKIVSSILFFGIDENNPFVTNLNTILILIFSFTYFWQLITKEQHIDFWQNPNFWICTGLVFYYVGSFLVISVIKFVFKTDKDLAVSLWNLVLLLNIVMYSSFIYAFKCQNLIHNS